MAIILDASGFLSKTYEGYFEKTLFTALARILPPEQLVYATAAGTQAFPSHMRTVVFPSQKGLFHQKKTEKWLAEQQATAFIGFKRMLKISNPITQVLIISAEDQVNDEKNITRADAMGMVSDRISTAFSEKYPALAAKSFLVAALVTDEIFLNSETGEDIKEQLTSGREYFICADFDLSKDKLTTLLKGFSAFKRMLQSSWKLVIVLRSEEGILPAEAETLLANYKYREDVVLTDESALPAKMAGAYTLVSMEEQERYPVPVVEAMAVNTPVIAYSTDTLKQMCGELVVYIDLRTGEAIGEGLMKMYKDEKFRQNLVKKIKNGQLRPNLDDTTRRLKAVLLKQ